MEILCKWAHTLYDSPNKMIVKYKALEEITLLSGYYFTALGSQLPTNKYVKVKLEGEWVEKKFNGQKVPQFQVVNATEIIPEDQETFQKFLNTGSIPGIGKILGKRIIAAFGENSYMVLKEDPDKLLEVKGFSPKKVDAIKEYFQSHKNIEEISKKMNFLLSPKQVRNIYETFGSRSMEVLEESIFHLYQVKGFNYQNICSLSVKLKSLHVNDPYRIRAGIVAALNENSKQGHTYMNPKDLEKKSYQLLNRNIDKKVTFSLLQAELIKMANSPLEMGTASGVTSYVVNGKIRYALSIYAEAEDYLARRIVELSMQDDICVDEKLMELAVLEDISKEEPIVPEEVLDKMIQDYMDETNLLLSKEQKEAVIAAQRKKFLIVTGGPGTGKTTIEKFMIHFMEILRPDEKIMLLAPTGRAARRMAESTEFQEASTIHSAARLFGEDDLIEFHGKDYLDADIIFVDEFSMVDTLVFMCLLKATKKGTQIIMIGDPDQLPSVQPGNVFKDMIDSGIVPLVRLQHVFRQGVGSLVSCNARLINRGETDVVWNDSDFKLVDTSKAENIEEETVRKILSIYGSLLQQYSYNDVQILTPFRKAETRKGYRKTSVEALNKLLQPISNPYANTSNICMQYNGDTFYRNDKIMESSNQTHESLSNGDIGVIKSIDLKGTKMYTLFNGITEITYKKSEISSLSLAYATTIHKSQGSEYPWVIIPLLRSYRGMLSRKLLYTAVTRAKEGVIFVGEYAAFLTAVRDDYTVERLTSLKDKILIDYANQVDTLKGPKNKKKERFEQLTLEY